MDHETEHEIRTARISLSPFHNLAVIYCIMTSTFVKLH